MNTNDIVKKLYQDIADSLNTTVEDVVYRTTTEGEKLVQFYYEWKYNWDGTSENCPW